MDKITHAPKGSMCIVCKQFGPTGNCPKTEDFKSMKQIGKHEDGVIIVKCNKFAREDK